MSSIENLLEDLLRELLHSPLGLSKGRLEFYMEKAILHGCDLRRIVRD